MYTDSNELIYKIGKELYYEITEKAIFEASIAAYDNNIHIKNSEDDQLFQTKFLNDKTNDYKERSIDLGSELEPSVKDKKFHYMQENLWINIGSKSALPEPNIEQISQADSESVSFIISKKKLQHISSNYI